MATGIWIAEWDKALKCLVYPLNPSVLTDFYSLESLMALAPESHGC